MPFNLISFTATNDIAVVPDSWCDDGEVSWPSFKSSDRIKRAVANCEEPEPNWLQYDMRVIKSCAHYKDAEAMLGSYGEGCNTSELQTDAELETCLPSKRPRRAVHRFGDDTSSDEDMGAPEGVSQLQSSPIIRGTASKQRMTHGTAPAPALSPPPEAPRSSVARHGGINHDAPCSGVSQLQSSPIIRGTASKQRMTHGTAPAPALSPPPEAPRSSVARHGGMNHDAPCSAFEVQKLTLLQKIVHQNEQILAKLDFLASRQNCPTPEMTGPEISNVQFPLEDLQAVDAFEDLLKDQANASTRQQIISSLSIIGGQDLKRITWNILGRIFGVAVAHQINWKGVNSKRAFSRMAIRPLLFCAVRKNPIACKSAMDEDISKHAIRWFNLAGDRATRKAKEINNH
ncbi:uncharacterized protein LOC134882355 [Eleginops maclovinus]